MKKTQTWRWVPVALLLLATGGTAGRAEEFAIQSFDGTGRLTFNEVSTAAMYRVEWAPSPGGPWTNTWQALAAIVAKGSGIVTCSVPMCYRVVATATIVLIPAGTNSGTDPDFGVYSLTNALAFYMDATEVTKARWDEVYTWALANGYGFDNAGSGKAANHPVQTVNWYDCAKWCNARSQKEGRTPCYTVGGNVYKTGQSAPDCNFAANGYRLPRNTEWEYAARGGASGRRFPWSDTDTIQHSRANYRSSSSYSYDTSPTRGYHPTYSTNSVPYTSPTGSFAANGYGLYDMAGNVWEWCWDTSGSSRYLRGGSWNYYANDARCGHLLGLASPELSYDFLGFRAVCR
jgi:formylglycine-generating enzyme required for sulfatase activity